MKRILALILLFILLIGCAPLAATIVPVGGTVTPTPFTASNTPRLPSPTPAATRQEVQRVVQVSLRARESTRVQPELDAGGTATLELLFEPVVQTIERRADGSQLSLSTARWEKHPVAQMRYCVGQGQPCPLLGEWRAFETSASLAVRLDWLGARVFYLMAEFRDASGQLLPAVRGYETAAGTTAEATLTVVSVLNAATPLERLPGPVLTAAAATRTAFPVSGSVVIEGGRCCAGGTAGAQISLKVEFLAKSTAGAVTEMRAAPGSGCIKDPAQLRGEWEPFQDTKSYTTTLALNWVGWYINVQYRDARGNLSPVYCDDISLEGSPGK